MTRRCLLLGIVLGVFACLCGNVAAAQWRWANPKPEGMHIFALTSRGSTVVQAGEFGQLYVSDDLDEWRSIDTLVTNALRSAVWFGPQLVVTCSEGVVLYGDTLRPMTNVNLGTSDWLEGVATSGTNLVAVGDNGSIYTSADGLSWQKRQSAPVWLRSVAYGASKYVAVGDAGFVSSSADGASWTSGSRLGSEDLNRVVWTGGRFWALGNAGTAFTSLNGLNWNSVNTGSTNDLFSAASDTNEVVVVGRGELRTSAGSFSSWTNKTSSVSPDPPVWTYYNAIWDGAEFLVGGRSGMFVEGYKPTGSTTNVWFTGSYPRNWLWDLTHVEGLYVAVGESGGIFTSADGFKLDQEAVPDTSATEIFEGIGGTTNMLVTVGTAGVVLWSQAGLTNVVSTNSTGGLITNQVNTLGLVWNAVFPRPSLNELQGVGVLGSTFIVTGGSGTILTSPDGQSWTLRLSPVSKMLSGVATSPSRAIAVGDTGAVLTSDDTVLWTKRNSGVTNWIYRACYAQNQFVAVGEAGVILTSPDGVAWTSRTSGTTMWLNAVGYQNGFYYAVGGQGTVLKSPDAITWTLLPFKTDKSIYGVAGRDGQLLVSGLEGAALRTPLLPWTTAVNHEDYSIKTNTQAFLFNGQMDQRFTLQRSPDMRRWVDIVDLEMLDNSGFEIFTDGVVDGAQFFFRTQSIDP